MCSARAAAGGVLRRASNAPSVGCGLGYVIELERTQRSKLFQPRLLLRRGGLHGWERGRAHGSSVIGAVRGAVGRRRRLGEEGKLALETHNEGRNLCFLRLELIFESGYPHRPGSSAHAHVSARGASGGIEQATLRQRFTQSHRRSARRLQSVRAHFAASSATSFDVVSVPLPSSARSRAISLCAADSRKPWKACRGVRQGRVSGVGIHKTSFWKVLSAWCETARVVALNAGSRQ